MTMPSSPNVIYKNDVAMTGAGNRILLLYYGGTMYAENTGNVWYSWTGSGWAYRASGAPISAGP